MSPGCRSVFFFFVNMVFGLKVLRGGSCLVFFSCALLRSASIRSPAFVLFIAANGPSFRLAGFVPSGATLGGLATLGDSVILSGRLFWRCPNDLVDCHIGCLVLSKARTSQKGQIDPAAALSMLWLIYFENLRQL